MKVLITGGFGYLGSIMAQALKEDGFDVALLGRRRPDYMADWAREFDVRLGDIKDEASLAGCFRDVDVVIHTAAANEIICAEDEREALLVNGYGARNVLREAANAGVRRFVYFSTFHVYGAAPGQVITETTPPAPVHSYGLTHLVGELYAIMAAAKNKALTSTSLRISNGYGAPVRREVPRWTLIISDLCRMAYTEGKIVLKSSGKQSRDFVAAADIYQALRLVLDRDGGGHEVYNVGGEDSKTMLEIAEIVKAVYARRYGREIPIEVLGADEPAQPPVVFNIDKLKALGFQPRGSIAGEVEKMFELLETGR